MIGLRFAEQMRGTFRRMGEDEARAITLDLQVFVDNGLRYLTDRKARVEGTAHLEGAVDHAPLRGHMIIDPLLSRVIRYDVRFVSTQGERLRLHGQKEISPLRLVESFTHLPAVIDLEEGAPWATATLSFDQADLPQFLRSFRLH